MAIMTATTNAFFPTTGALLAEAGIACPWLDDATGIAGWEERLLNKLKAANKGKTDIADGWPIC